jgi:hypothetical protein
LEFHAFWVAVVALFFYFVLRFLLIAFHIFLWL